jgi:hypothetical protein
VRRRYSIGEMFGNRSMGVRNMGISHSIERVALIPWMRWNNVKTVVVLTSMQ